MTATQRRATPAPTAVRAITTIAAQQVKVGTLDAAWGNTELLRLGTQDVAAACLAWRNMTNIVRLADRDDLEDLIAEAASGTVIASAFHPDKARATINDREVAIVGTRLMATGVRYASSLLLEASTSTGASLLVVVPASAIVSVLRPSLLGLADADNALVDVSMVVPRTNLITEPGDARRLIELPYNLGLTLGSVLVGIARRAWSLGADPSGDEDLSERASLQAQIAAAEALVAITPNRAPCAAWHAKAAKLAAYAAAEAACHWARCRLGSAAYATDHELNGLEADLRGLAHQAPTNANVVTSVARGDGTTWRPTT